MKDIVEALLEEAEAKPGLICEIKPAQAKPSCRSPYSEPPPSARTAISRTEPSKPTRMVAGEFQKKILDYGQGKGKDVEWLRDHIKGYDPYYENRPELLTDNTYDVVLNNYVLNVIPAKEREMVLRDIVRILKPCGYAYISVRDDSEKVAGTPHEDGVITAKGTFQKLFNAEELKNLLQKYFEEVTIISRKAPLLARARKRC